MCRRNYEKSALVCTHKGQQQDIAAATRKDHRNIHTNKQRMHTSKQNEKHYPSVQSMSSLQQSTPINAAHIKRTSPHPKFTRSTRGYHFIFVFKQILYEKENHSPLKLIGKMQQLLATTPSVLQTTTPSTTLRHHFTPRTIKYNIFVSFYIISHIYHILPHITSSHRQTDTTHNSFRW